MAQDEVLDFIKKHKKLQNKWITSRQVYELMKHKLSGGVIHRTLWGLKSRGYLGYKADDRTGYFYYNTEQEVYDET